MSADIADDVVSSVARRWRRIDPLLPEPEPLDGNCRANLIVPGKTGRAAAVGWCRHHQTEAEAAELTWRARTQFWLTAQVAGDPEEPALGTGLDELLVRWRAHLATEPATATADSQAAIRWPSRDVAGARALLRHGLKPLTVIAARPAGRAMPDAASGRGGLRIRLAGPADVAAVTALSLDVIRFDQHFGSARMRPHTERLEQLAVTETLAQPEPWTWLAERDGEVAGLLVAVPPGQTGWIATAVRQRPVAYLATMSVRPDERGSGVGTALVAMLHRELDAAGVAVTLVHHAQLNPLSVPFWSRMGYRPLWASWETRPASALR